LISPPETRHLREKIAPVKNDTFLRALLREPTPHTPVWIMRQAGRYLPEYNETRRKAGSFLVLAKTPELACEVTLQPLRRFALDAAIIFSDILTVPDAMGLGLHFVEGEGPRFERPLRSEEAIAALEAPDLERLRYVFDAIALTRRELDGSVPLIGFSGSPFTLACYMVEGGGSDDFRRVKTLLYSRPDLLHRILAVNARAVIDYLNAQIAAGAQAVMIFDTWGGALADDAFEEFSLAYSRQVLAGLTRMHEGRVVPRILFTKGGGAWLEAMSESGADALGIDWQTNLGEARRRVGSRVALQGNLDPMALFAPPEAIDRQVERVLRSYGGGPGHVFNLGHGVSQFTPPEHVGALVEAVHSRSLGAHAA
jgi:uroporphyrinogen decarboxylase